MPSKFARLCVIASLLPLISCAQTMGSSGPIEPRVVDSFCSVAKPILWSKADTDKTLLAVKEHNAVGKRLCGWGRSPTPPT